MKGSRWATARFMTRALFDLGRNMLGEQVHDDVHPGHGGPRSRPAALRRPGGPPPCPASTWSTIPFTSASPRRSSTVPPPTSSATRARSSRTRSANSSRSVTSSQRSKDVLGGLQQLLVDLLVDGELATALTMPMSIPARTAMDKGTAIIAWRAASFPRNEKDRCSAAAHAAPGQLSLIRRVASMKATA